VFAASIVATQPLPLSSPPFQVWSVGRRHWGSTPQPVLMKHFHCRGQVKGAVPPAHSGRSPPPTCEEPPSPDPDKFRASGAKVLEQIRGCFIRIRRRRAYAEKALVRIPSVSPSDGTVSLLRGFEATG
jgi:hypothetical protein